MSECARIAAPKTKLNGWRLAVVRTGLLAGGLVFVLFALEISLRIMGVRVPTSTVLSAYFEYDPITGWRGTPNAEGRFVTSNFDSMVSHDADGWRRTELTESIDDDANSTQRVVWCVGDSMTWGWGVSDGETFVDQLNREAGPSTRFRNLGIPGYSAVQEFLQLKQQFDLGRRPDQIILFFCPNDWEENLASPRSDPRKPWAGHNDDVWAIEGIPVPQTFAWTVRSWFRRNSLAFGFVNYHYKRASQWKTTHLAQNHHDNVVPDPTETEQQAMRFVYREIQELCREHQVEFTVATNFTSYPALERICGELDIRLIVATEQLPLGSDSQSTKSDQALSFATDHHWTPLGHARIARAIRERMDRSPAMARGGSGKLTR